MLVDADVRTEIASDPGHDGGAEPNRSRPCSAAGMGPGARGSTASPPPLPDPTDAGRREGKQLIPGREGRGPRPKRPKKFRVHVTLRGKMGLEGFIDPAAATEKGQGRRGDHHESPSSRLSRLGHERGADLHRRTIDSARRRWHNGVLSPMSVPRPNDSVARRCRSWPTLGRLLEVSLSLHMVEGLGNLAARRLWRPPPTCGRPDRGSCPPLSRGCCCPTRDAAGRQRPTRPAPPQRAGPAPRACRPSAAERGQAARATATHAGAARTRDPTSSGTGPSACRWWAWAPSHHLQRAGLRNPATSAPPAPPWPRVQPLSPAVGAPWTAGGQGPGCLPLLGPSEPYESSFSAGRPSASPRRAAIVETLLLSGVEGRAAGIGSGSFGIRAGRPGRRAGAKHSRPALRRVLRGRKRRIEANRTYPQEASRRGQSGQGLVGFVLRNGPS